MKNTPPTSDFPSTPLALDDAASGPVEPDLAAVDGPIPLVTDKSEQLSPAQARAIEMLASGHTVATAAEAVGVGRTTIYRWLKGDAAFVAAFNAWQQDMLDTARGRLLALTDTAVNAVSKSMEKGDAKTALALLKHLGALRRPTPGPTDPADVERLQDLQWRKARNTLKKKENRAAMDDLFSL
jgi:AcrR family transcriptional regulator